MHRQTEVPVPLKDTSSQRAKQLFMDFPDLAKKKAHGRPLKTESEKTAQEVIVPHENDILLGRGGKNNTHVGNENLRELARKVADKYHVSSKKEKSYLSRTLVQKVKEMDPPGRFLRRHPKTNQWIDMSEDEDKCREKCAQVLRDAVAYVGLKDPPPPSMAQREQQLHSNPSFSMRHNPTVLSPRQQPYPMQVSPFAMSASSSHQIMRHQHELLAGRDLPPLQGRQFSFPNYNPPNASRNSLAPSTGVYEPLTLPSGYASLSHAVPQSVPLNAGAQLQGDGSFRAPKRRRMSNAFFDPFATMPGDVAPFGIDRRLSMSSNSYPAGSDFPHGFPGPRVRRDSLFGNVSLGPHGSDHAALRDFELFPDIVEHPAENPADCVPPKNDSDEFASDFY